jgi:hypothetical protein
VYFCFRREFLALLSISELKTFNGHLEFHTQFGYKQKITVKESDADQTEPLDRGCFDILILAKDFFAKEFNFIIVIEVKVEADFHDTVMVMLLIGLALSSAKRIVFQS